MAYPYWKSEVRINLIQDNVGYPVDYVNQVGFKIVRMGVGRGGMSNPCHKSGYAYLPVVHMD